MLKFQLHLSGVSHFLNVSSAWFGPIIDDEGDYVRFDRISSKNTVRGHPLVSSFLMMHGILYYCPWLVINDAWWASLLPLSVTVSARCRDDGKIMWMERSLIIQGNRAESKKGRIKVKPTFPNLNMNMFACHLG